jgi:hypothetical protein
MSRALPDQWCLRRQNSLELAEVGEDRSKDSEDDCARDYYQLVVLRESSSCDGKVKGGGRFGFFNWLCLILEGCRL